MIKLNIIFNNLDIFYIKFNFQVDKILQKYEEVDSLKNKINFIYQIDNIIKHYPKNYVKLFSNSIMKIFTDLYSIYSS